MPTDPDVPSSRDRAAQLRQDALRARDIGEELRLLALDLDSRSADDDGASAEIAGALSLVMASMSALYAGLADVVEAAGAVEPRLRVDPSE